MVTLLLPLLPLLAKFAPDLIGLALEGGAQSVATRVELALRDIFGTADAADITAQAAADPAKADALRLRLAAEAAAVKAELADLSDARAATLALAKAGSPLQWGAAVMSAVIVAGFVALSVFMAWHPIPETPLVTGLVQTMQYAFVAVVGYWLGSSSGSQAKTEHLAAIAARPRTP
jgi:hypothetical protein